MTPPILTASVTVARPVLMPVWMLVTAVIIGLVVCAWLIGTLISTRRDSSRQAGDVPMAPEDRQNWLTAVEDAAARYRDGSTDLRGLHLELATAGPRSVEERMRLVRRGGRPLDTNPLGHVGELLYVWEQPSFDRDTDAAAEEAVTLAREVVTRW